MKKIILTVFILSLFACSKESEAVASYGLKKEAQFDMQENEVLTEDDEIERKIIKEGWFTFESDDLIETKNSVIKSVKKYNAYISSDSENRYTGRINNRLIIRVPIENFDLLLDEISKEIKSIDRKEISLRDVTEEFIDVESRLNNKRALEKRYLELLQKATTVTEILEVEREIAKLRSDIESTEGRLNYLKHSVSFSTIDLTIYQRTEVKKLYGSRFSDGLADGWGLFVSFLIFLINIWPFLIIITGIIFLVRHLRKKRRLSK